MAYIRPFAVGTDRCEFVLRIYLLFRYIENVRAAAAVLRNAEKFRRYFIVSFDLFFAFAEPARKVRAGGAEIVGAGDEIKTLAFAEPFYQLFHFYVKLCAVPFAYVMRYAEYMMRP